ncbi:hypothetical protein INT48_005729 [Thamnidium elegans]|uniref:Uncharacterized protein n=1 Tax=Thamnidium elegans TaxID=101142 RepID=A0A8H7SQC5_9FUNG|nr:hypothetical protein INT48_005729 [Thamnidium elegans]
MTRIAVDHEQLLHALLLLDPTAATTLLDTNTVSAILENGIHDVSSSSSSSSVVPTNSANDIHAAQLTTVTPSPAPLVIAVPTTGYTSTMVINGQQKEVVVTVKQITNDSHIRPCYRKGKRVPFSQYWIPKENEWDEDNDGERVYLAGDIKKPLLDKNKKEIGLVPIDMYDKCEMEGTCLLENGDLINIDNSTKSFIKVGQKGRQHNVFGLGSGSQNLVPFVSVAANDIPYGQTLYIEKLDGLDLGNNQKHNGCVRVDDDSWSFNTCQIDFFVLSYVDYLWLDLDDKVSVEFTECKVKNYITRHHLALVKATTDQTIIPSLLDAKYVS